MKINREIKRGLTIEYLVKLSRRRVKDEVWGYPHLEQTTAISFKSWGTQIVWSRKSTLQWFDTKNTLSVQKFNVCEFMSAYTTNLRRPASNSTDTSYSREASNRKDASNNRDDSNSRAVSNSRNDSNCRDPATTMTPAKAVTLSITGTPATAWTSATLGQRRQQQKWRQKQQWR